MQRASLVRSRGEERANAWIHAGGLALAAIGGLALERIAATPVERGAIAVLAASAMLLFAASALHHGTTSARSKRLFLAFDHGAVMVLIAGSYSAFAMLGLDAARRWWLIGPLWAVTVLALALGAAAFATRREALFERLAPALDLAMGWLPLIVFGRALGAALPWHASALLVAGGVAYSVGVLFYLSARRWAHAGWHLAVVLGCGLHFAAIVAAIG